MPQPQDDLNSLPKVVRQAKEEALAAEEQLKQLLGGIPTVGDQSVDTPQGANPAQPHEGVQNPQHPQDPQNPQPPQTLQIQQPQLSGQLDLTQPQPPVNPQVDTDPGRVERERNWENSFRTLQGKYDAEVPKLHAELRGRDARIAQMDLQFQQSQRQIAELQQTVSQLQQQNQKPDDKQNQPQDRQIQFDPNKMAEDYGPEFAAIGQLVQDQSNLIKGQQAQIAQLTQALQQINGQVQVVNQNQMQSKQERFESDLTALAPNWRQVDQDPAFHMWLDSADPNTGIFRRQLVTPFWGRDPARVAQYYNAFAQSYYQANPQVPNPSPQPNPQQPVQQPQQQPQMHQQVQQPYRNPLEAQVEPSRAASDTAMRQHQQPQEKIYTVEEIDNFYATIAKRGMGMTVEDRNKDADIMRAVSEGRVSGKPTVGRMEPGDIQYVR